MDDVQPNEPRDQHRQINLPHDRLERRKGPRAWDYGTISPYPTVVSVMKMKYLICITRVT